MILRFLTILVFWRRVMRLLSRRPRTIYVGDRVDEYRDLWSAAARAIEADFDALAPAVWEVRSGTRWTRISNDLVQFDDPVVLDLAGDKSFCYELAHSLGVPRPEPLTFRKEELARVIRRFPLDRGPYVVKPAKGTGSGVGVSVGVRSRLELANAIALASVHSSTIIIERLVAAETVRLLFLDGRMIHAVRRRGVRVETDGITSIEQLVARLTPRPVPIDALVRETVRQQGRSLADVPPGGEELVVRWLPAEIGSSRELRTIYDEEVTNLVSPALVEEVAPLLAALGSQFAGVDLLTNDPTRSLAEAGGVFLEINTTPGLHHHCTPSADGAACDVAVTVLRRLLDRDTT
jgi:D-alanine-D-alanine ligase-like ATP-grasp enzyme